MVKKRLKRTSKTKNTIFVIGMGSAPISKANLTEAFGAVTAILDTGKIPKKFKSKNPFITGLIKFKKRK
jgi:hypothetical protein